MIIIVIVVVVVVIIIIIMIIVIIRQLANYCGVLVQRRNCLDDITNG